MSEKKKVIESSLKGINDLFFGEGYIKGIPVGVFGKFGSGKTIFAIQEACKIASQIGKDILYVDTESGASEMIKLWMPVFAKQFNFKNQFVVKRITNLKDMLAFHGKLVDFQIYKKEAVDPKTGDIKKTAKVDTLWLGDCSAGIEDYFKKGCGIVVYDSMTRMLHQFTSVNYLFGARADAVNLWMEQMFDIAEKYGVYVLGIHHLSKNPSDEQHKPVFVGGKAIGHAFKVMLCLEQREFAPQKTVRDVWLTRYFNKEEWLYHCYTRITENGYIDMTKEEVALLAGGKKAQAKKAEETKKNGEKKS